MRVKKLSPTLGLGYIMAGVAFLITPMLAVVDVLPDFIGYAFILKGIYCLADMEERIADAARLFRRLLIFSVIRLGLVLFIYGMASKNEQPTLQLLCAFVLAVVDSMTIIPAWKGLRNGLIYLGTRHEGRAIFDKSYSPVAAEAQGRGKTLIEKLFSFTVFFLVTREVLSVLPEFAVLSHEMGGADAGNRTSLYEYIALMRGMCAILVAVLGIIWLWCFIRYFRHLLKDRPFFEKLCDKYSREVLTRPELFARRGVKLAMIFLSVGTVCTVDLFLDDICVTPDFLFGILAIIGLLLLMRYVKSSAMPPALVAAVAYIILTAGEWVLQMDYFRISDGVAAYRREDIYERWVHMNIVRAVTLILGMVMFFLILKVLMEAVNKYTGFSINAHDSRDPYGRVKAVHEDLHRRLWISLGFFGVASLASMVYMATLPLASNSLWEAWIFVDTVLSGVFAAVFIHTVTQIFEQIDYKYMLS